MYELLQNKRTCELGRWIAAISCFAVSVCCMSLGAEAWGFGDGAPGVGPLAGR
jgi:hypothetical protein